MRNEEDLYRSGDIVCFKRRPELLNERLQNALIDSFNLNPWMRFELTQGGFISSGIRFAALPATIFKDGQARAVTEDNLFLVKEATASRAKNNLYTATVIISAPSQEQALTAVGMMLRTDAHMFSLQQTPYTSDCSVNWESLRVTPVTPAPTPCTP